LWAACLAYVASKANEWTGNLNLVRSLSWHGRTSPLQVRRDSFASKVWRDASLRYHFYGLVSWNERIQDDPSQRPNQRPRVDTWQHSLGAEKWFEIFELPILIRKWFANTVGLVDTDWYFNRWHKW
jgi:hypothetical protein